MLADKGSENCKVGPLERLGDALSRYCIDMGDICGEEFEE